MLEPEEYKLLAMALIVVSTLPSVAGATPDRHYRYPLSLVFWYPFPAERCSDNQLQAAGCVLFKYLYRDTRWYYLYIISLNMLCKLCDEIDHSLNSPDTLIENWIDFTHSID